MSIRKLFGLLSVLPLTVTACSSATSTTSDKKTTLGIDENYITIGSGDDAKKFSKDNFYQIAKTSGWQEVSKWFNREISKHIFDSVSAGDEGFNTTLKNALNQFDMFKTGGNPDFAKATNIIAAELIKEEWQTYKIMNGDQQNYSFALNIKKQGYNIVGDVNDADATEGSTTHTAGTWEWFNYKFADYIREKIHPTAAEHLLTMSYLISLESATQSSGGAVYPATRLANAFTNNKPTYWTIYKYEADSFADARANIEAVSVNAEAFNTTTLANLTATEDAKLRGATGFINSYGGIGITTNTYNAWNKAVNIINSTNNTYRKEGFIDYESSATEHDFIAKPNDSDDFYYVYHAVPIDLKKDSNGALDQQDPLNVSAANLEEETRLLAYYGLSKLGDMQSYAKNFYYEQFKLEAFDSVIHKNLTDIINNK